MEKNEFKFFFLIKDAVLMLQNLEPFRKLKLEKKSRRFTKIHFCVQSSFQKIV